MIVNLHGLNSIGENTAYKKLNDYFGPNVEIISPTYRVYNFEKGMRDIESAIKDFTSETLVFVGSSTGALFAEALAEKYNGQVVLFNPVSDIKQIWARTVARQINHYTGEEYDITEDDFKTFPEPVIDETLDIPRLIFYNADDNVLNHARAEYKYRDKRGSNIFIYSGTSHRFEDWDDALPRIYKFYYRIYG